MEKKPVFERLIRCVGILSVVFLVGCATSPPDKPDNICDVFSEKKGWYKASRKAYKKWGMPIHVQMAIIHQESRFDGKAKPARKKFLWVIPAGRVSSAYGYGQALDGTWKSYKKETGNRGADRDKFHDAVDFIGWYGKQSADRLGISKWDAKRQYLAYHEGHGGYERRTYRKKKWLISVANKVDANASRYRGQLSRCENKFKKGWSLWPF